MMRKRLFKIYYKHIVLFFIISQFIFIASAEPIQTDTGTIYQLDKVNITFGSTMYFTDIVVGSNFIKLNNTQIYFIPTQQISVRIDSFAPTEYDYYITGSGTLQIIQNLTSGSSYNFLRESTTIATSTLNATNWIDATFTLSGSNTYKIREASATSSSSSGGGGGGGGGVIISEATPTPIPDSETVTIAPKLPLSQYLSDSLNSIKSSIPKLKLPKIDKQDARKWVLYLFSGAIIILIASMFYNGKKTRTVRRTRRL